MKQLLVIGSMNMDFVTHLDHMPAVGETILAQGLELVPGGKGANQAYAMGKLGGHATLLGAVGADSQGTKLCDNLASVGVDVSRVLHLEDAATGMAVIGVQPQGDNSIIVLPGANSRVTPDYIRQNLDVLEASDIVVLQLEIPLETVVYAAQTAKRLGKQVILDPAPAVAHLPEDLFPCLDLIKPNETELGILTGRPYEPARLREDALSLQAKGVRRVLVTLGGAGSYLLREDGSQEFFQADPHVTVVDTTAAGDSFVGALAVSLSRGRDLADAARFASRVADIVVSRPGAQSSIPYLEE